VKKKGVYGIGHDKELRITLSYFENLKNKVRIIDN
jgi:hypothetical protein